MLLSDQAGSHGASRRGPDAPLHADTPEAGVGVFGGQPAVTEVAVECPAPGTYADDRRCNAEPMQSQGDASGFLSMRSRNPHTPAEASQGPVHRSHWLEAPALAFSAPVPPGGVCFGPELVRRLHPGHGSENDRRDLPGWLCGAVVLRPPFIFNNGGPGQHYRLSIRPGRRLSRSGRVSGATYSRRSLSRS